MVSHIYIIVRGKGSGRLHVSGNLAIQTTGFALFLTVYTEYVRRKLSHTRKTPPG